MESEGVLHKLWEGVAYDVTFVLDDDGHEKSASSSSSTRIIPLEIDFEMSEKYQVFEINFSERRVIGPLRQSPVHVINRHQCTINDIRRCSETTAYLNRRLSPVLSLLGIEEDKWDLLTAMIVRCCRRRIAAVDAESNKPQVLRMRVCILRVHILFPCEGCSKQRDALIMESLKRVRVRVRVAGPVADEEEEEEEELEGRERKLRRVVVGPESESCPICLEEFDGGSDDDDDLSCTPCSHVFHCKCIGKWIEGGHHNCPYCRSKIMPSIDLASIICGPSCLHTVLSANSIISDQPSYPI